MTEKEKMLAGLDYIAFDSELTKDRLEAKKLCHRFNQVSPDDKTQQAEVLNELLGTLSEAWIEPFFYCDYGYNIHLGENFYANHHCTILDGAKVTIGNDVLFGPSVTISTAGHPLDSVTRNTGLEFCKPITIGNNVWLGANVSVNPGVTIGDNSVIGAGSVVTRDIPANSVAVGAPCRVIKSVMSKEAILSPLG
ncbi:sugar O-acetyltransferase [Endozoicomonas sp. 8E]|uniref:sugar O-acetyltransferase n=1 Tax=Endozoicomonas sp. 8E TaxID=3035692 RepID=UPI002938E6CA|nr:sugar O-acetyltransferase [Endozoicomonas sp. 8E]WOG27346.1 sugar O-acetyltransferase [Endozoicomonas sp. 8E]